MPCPYFQQCFAALFPTSDKIKDFCHLLPREKSSGDARREGYLGEGGFESGSYQLSASPKSASLLLSCRNKKVR